MMPKNKVILVLITLLITSSCVSELSNKQTSNYRMGVSFLETSCRKNNGDYSVHYYNIKNTYEQLSLKYPLAFSSYIPVIYSIQNPMRISEDSMKARLDKFHSRFKSLEIEENQLSSAVDEISKLYFEMLRFETQKCSFSNLAKIEYKDIRILVDAHAFCKEVIGDINCEGEVILPSNKTKMEEIYLSLCQGQNNRKQSCRESYVLSLRNSSTISNIRNWLWDFKDSSESSFKLLSTASKFRCQKNFNKSIMHIEVYSSVLNEYELRQLLDFSEKMWSNTHLEIKFEIVYQKSPNTVEINLTDKMVSFVPQSDTKQIYLSQHLAKEQSKRILAHEFGHVLGFPDCYMEFYSKSNKELVYYELEHKDNLMCAVDLNNTIPADYFVQLQEKSCKWD